MVRFVIILPRPSGSCGSAAMYDVWQYDTVIMLGISTVDATDMLMGNPWPSFHRMMDTVTIGAESDEIEQQILY